MSQSSVATVTKEESGVLFQDILVAYDFSEASETALRYAASFARTYGGFVNVVSVQSAADYTAEVESGSAQKESHRQLVDDLQAIAQRLSAQGIRNRVMHRAGAVADVLVQMAAELKADLLLLGAYGHKGIDRPRLGSTAEYMLRSMPCAVLTIGPGAVLHDRDVPPLKMVLCASSLPQKAGSAARKVAAMAKMSDASVEMFHVVDKQAKVREMRTDDEMGAAAENLVKNLEGAGIHAAWKLVSGPQGQRIVERANETHADLIVFGLEHVPGYPDAMGTISMAIWQASCPVLTVPGPA
jgi:nucleotide-binding universal stress UspA family protein